MVAASATLAVGSTVTSSLLMTSRTVVIVASKPSPRPVRRKALLDWYEPRRSIYPWRCTSDPYRILVSEVMLQQTQAARVEPAYRAFLRRFPTLRSLASAPRSGVLIAWDGLGYNRRAVALSEAGRAIVREHDGKVPSDPEALRRLPGLGPYTSAAVASIAFGVPVAAVDTNVRRIVSRVFLGSDPELASATDVRVLADRWVDRRDPGAWNQALMDLGREVCRPDPRCDRCPLRPSCRFASRRTRPKRGARASAPFEGSSRQARGAVIGVLRADHEISLGELVDRSGLPSARIAAAVKALAAEGLVGAGPAALGGRPRGRIRLPR